MFVITKNQSNLSSKSPEKEFAFIVKSQKVEIRLLQSYTELKYLLVQPIF
jgi:hypothetical protein